MIGVWYETWLNRVDGRFWMKATECDPLDKELVFTRILDTPAFEWGSDTCSDREFKYVERPAH